MCTTFCEPGGTEGGRGERGKWGNKGESGRGGRRKGGKRKREKGGKGEREKGGKGGEGRKWVGKGEKRCWYGLLCRSPVSQAAAALSPNEGRRGSLEPGCCVRRRHS